MLHARQPRGNRAPFATSFRPLLLLPQAGFARCSPDTLELRPANFLRAPPRTVLALSVGARVCKDTEVIDPMTAVVRQHLAVLEHINLPNRPEVFADLDVPGES